MLVFWSYDLREIAGIQSVIGVIEDDLSIWNGTECSNNEAECAPRTGSGKNFGEVLGANAVNGRRTSLCTTAAKLRGDIIPRGIITLLAETGDKR